MGKRLLIQILKIFSICGRHEVRPIFSLIYLVHYDAINN